MPSPTYSRSTSPDPTSRPDWCDDASPPSHDKEHAMMPRPDRHDAATVQDASWAVHGGNRSDRTTGAIRTPLIASNSYRLPRDPDHIDTSDPDYLIYGREAGANQVGLQDKLA